MLLVLCVIISDVGNISRKDHRWSTCFFRRRTPPEFPGFPWRALRARRITCFFRPRPPLRLPWRLLRAHGMHKIIDALVEPHTEIAKHELA
jgi:hypothetical protein